MSTTTTAPATATAPLTIAGLRLTNYRQNDAATQETTAFTATVLTAEGERLGVLANDGRGGAHAFRAESRDADTKWTLAVAEYATDNPLDYDYPGADAEALAEALSMAAFMARTMNAAAPSGRMILAPDLNDTETWLTCRAVPGPDRPALVARVAASRSCSIHFTVPRQSWPHVATVAATA